MIFDCSAWLRRVLFALVAVLLLTVSLDQAFAESPLAWKVNYQPSRLVNGAPVLFQVKAPRNLSQLQATWMDHSIVFRESHACGCWYAIAGIALSTKPGQYPLELQATSATGHKLRHQQEISVTAAKYPSTTIKVAPEYVEPPKETLARIEEEQKVKKQAFSSTTNEPTWTGSFEAPAEAATTSVFGSARLYNGVKKNQHTGLDFRVTTGTPIHATNAGTVILARPLYFEGNCVAVDHGAGLITIYMHFSELKVKEGDKVARGQILGLSGGTGRVTAPHLHFAVRWQGEYLNPATLLKFSPP
jgi:murein DD-endopeptidase MepM/ murein hydrolase activator NlpD